MSEQATVQRILLILVIGWVGCSDVPPPSVPATDELERKPTALSDEASAGAAAETTETPMALPSISLGGAEQASEPVPPSNAEQHRRRALIDAMQPLQIMLGTWKGTTQREFGDFKALDEPEWVWDFQTDPEQPALVMTSAASPYFRSLRLTWLTDQEEYQLLISRPEGEVRTLTGQFSQPVEEFQGDDKRLHRRYKLELTEENPSDAKDAWQILFNQQENNRYLVELSRQRGSRFMRFDTVAHQRQGTSFAMDDADYGEQACIITGGLGTSTVTYNGKTYWVCCSGCRAAFEDDPKKWIAAAAELKSE